MWGALTVVVALTVTAGCGDEYELLATVKTDLVPSEEFTAVEVELRKPGAEETIAREHTPVFAKDRTLTGVAVANFGGLGPGAYEARVRLLEGSGETAVERLVRIELSSNYHFTAVLSRDCRGVSCPGDDGDPNLTACLGGQCVDPRCTTETQEFCAPPECASDTDCAPADACAVGRCDEGTCLSVQDPEACGPGTWCDPDRGCRPRTLSTAPDTCPTPCSAVAPACGCDLGSACRVTVDGMACGPTGPGANGTACDSDADCVEGSTCNRINSARGVCSAYCREHVDCPGSACSLLVRSVPTGACLAKCDPETNTGCPATLDCIATLVLDLNEEGIRVASCGTGGELAAGEPCEPGESCAAGSICIDAVCRQLCRHNGPTCPTRCWSTNPPLVVGDQLYGYCI